MDNMISLFSNITEELDETQGNLENMTEEIETSKKELKKLLKKSENSGEGGGKVSKLGGEKIVYVDKKEKKYVHSLKKEYEVLKDFAQNSVKRQFKLKEKPKIGVNLCINCDIYFRQRREDGDSSLFK